MADQARIPARLHAHRSVRPPIYVVSERDRGELGVWLWSLASNQWLPPTVRRKAGRFIELLELAEFRP